MKRYGQPCSMYIRSGCLFEDILTWYRHLPRAGALLVAPVRSYVCWRDQETAGASVGLTRDMTGPRTRTSRFEGEKGRWRGSGTSRGDPDPAKVYRCPCLDPQPLQPPTPSHPPRHFQTTPSRRFVPVEPTASLTVLKKRFRRIKSVSLTVPSRLPTRHSVRARLFSEKTAGANRHWPTSCAR